MFALDPTFLSFPIPVIFLYPPNGWQLNGGRAKAEIAKQLKKLAEAYSARGDRWRSWQLAKAPSDQLVRRWNLVIFP